MFIKWLAITALLLLSNGCVTIGSKYSTVVHSDPSKALVLFYRPHPPVNILLTNSYAYVHAADLYLGEQKLAALSVNSFTYIEVESGLQTFSVREQLLGAVIEKIEFELHAGQTYYLRYLFRVNALMQPEFSFRIVPSEFGEREIKKTRYIALVDR